MRTLLLVTLLAGAASAQETMSALEAEVEALRAPAVAWREIPWKSCLLDGLAAARADDKPIVCWIFIDRPVDDQRC